MSSMTAIKSMPSQVDSMHSSVVRRDSNNLQKIPFMGKDGRESSPLIIPDEDNESEQRRKLLFSLKQNQLIEP